MSTPYQTPSHVDDRDSAYSVQSGGFTAIGTMLASPYDGSEDEVIRTPVTPERPRVGTVRESRYIAPGKVDLVKRIQSFEGQFDDIGKDARDSVYSDEEEGTVLAFDKPALSRSVSFKLHQSPESGRVRPPTVVHFPQPTFVSPVRSPATIRPQPSRPMVKIPESPANLHPQGHVEVYAIPSLPCSGTPVSPHLALPPLSPPRTPFSGSVGGGRGARGSVSSVSSESIQGFDVMKEKKALFRGGEDELLSPFSPRRGRQESGLRPGPRRGANRGVSVADFWKRFSVSVRMDEAGKESAWLNDTQTKRKNIRWIALAVILAILIIGAGVAAVVVVMQNMA